jgi:DNA-binding MarR family transcriptional regulator
MTPSGSGPANAKLPPRTGPGASGLDQGAQHRRLLVGTAYHSGLGSRDCCLTALAVLSASRALRRTLAFDLGPSELSETGFVTLVTLYALEPVACAPEALAHDAEVNLEAMSGVLDFLERRGWVSRELRGPQGSSPRIHLTDAGIETTVLAVHRFLDISATLAADLGPDEHRAATRACAQIVGAAAGTQRERSNSEFHS